MTKLGETTGAGDNLIDEVVCYLEDGLKYTVSGQLDGRPCPNVNLRVGSLGKMKR